jgi:hypothetical protein
MIFHYIFTVFQDSSGHHFAENLYGNRSHYDISAFHNCIFCLFTAENLKCLATILPPFIIQLALTSQKSSKISRYCFSKIISLIRFMLYSKRSLYSFNAFHNFTSFSFLEQNYKWFYLIVSR